MMHPALGRRQTQRQHAAVTQRRGRPCWPSHTSRPPAAAVAQFIAECGRPPRPRRPARPPTHAPWPARIRFPATRRDPLLCRGLKGGQHCGCCRRQRRQCQCQRQRAAKQRCSGGGGGGGGPPKGQTAPLPAVREDRGQDAEVRRLQVGLLLCAGVPVGGVGGSQGRLQADPGAAAQPIVMWVEAHQPPPLPEPLPNRLPRLSL